MKKLIKWLFVALAVLLIVVLMPRTPPEEGTMLRGPTMGTTYTVRLAARLSEDERQAWQQRIQRVLDRVNEQMSTYLPDSEISRFNRSEATDWFSVSSDTAVVVSTALDVARQTDGAFDITVGPLVNLWSFGPDRRPKGIPTEAEIAAARDVVDYRSLQVRLEPPALRKQEPRISIDLSGIAKGYAVDLVADLLDGSGQVGYMVEIGGEVRTKGGKWDGQPWRIGLEKPLTDRRAIESVLEVRDCHLASSGDFRNFFDWEGRIYSHMIDPRTGWPVQDGLAAVSVMGPSVMVADAMATALMILPPDEAWQLVQRTGLEAQLVVREEGGFRNLTTPEFPILGKVPPK